VVVLVDEYDKPILNNITDSAVALQMREGLKDFYSVIKDSDAHIRFVLLTGVSKFSKVSLFSGLNNLTDITLDARYSALFGYTDADVDSVFAPELPGLDREEVRRWYNGYNWLGTSVYNPFDTTNHGRIDMDKGYADKYRAHKQPIHLIGVEFSKASRNIVGFGVETLSISYLYTLI
jgi:hypothetical protein